MMSESEKSSGNVSLMTFTNHSPKKWAKAEEEMEKSRLRMNQLDLTVKFVAVQWSDKLGRFGKFYACKQFPDCRHTQAIVKEIGVECPSCHQGQIIERKTKRNRLFLWLQSLSRM